MLYERSMMLKVWIPRIASAIERHADRLRSTVYIGVDFLALSDMGPITEIPDEAVIRQSISSDLHRKDGMVVLSVGDAFERGMQDVSNVSERVLVDELCRALFDLFRIELTDETFQRLLTQIVPNDAARYVHAFYASQFRDFVSPSLRGQIIESDELDSAILRSGLAFCVESRTKGRFSTRSKRQATQFLNSLVHKLESQLIGVCQSLDRNQLLEQALWNHERAVQSRQRWMRTAKANFALRQQSSGVAEVIAARDIELSDTIFASLIVAEIALCESPVEGGLQPGTLDLCRLQCLAGAIAHFGGWSDAIHMDAMSPRLTITALGDVQVDDEFRSQILMPFAKAGSGGRIREAIHRYAENFEPPSVGKSSRTLNSDFEDAWKTEFGFSILEMRQAIDLLEDIGIKQAVAVFSMSWGDFLRIVESAVADATKFIEAFVLNSRTEWRDIPSWCDVKDIQIWRFRRQLSVVRRPVLRVTTDGDSRVLIAPGIIRESIAYILDGYYEGTLPPRHYRSEAMRRWHGRRTNERGTQFSQAVAGAFTERGWHAEIEQKVHSLIDCGRDTDFGDVDVVAWNVDAKRVLIIECKHLYYGKTAGEIAEQLRDYRGKVRHDCRRQRRDDLRKHLDRIEVITEHRAVLLNTLGLPHDMQIEGWILFKNPVPMLFGWDAFADKVQIATFEDIDRIAVKKG